MSRGSRTRYVEGTSPFRPGYRQGLPVSDNLPKGHLGKRLRDSLSHDSTARSQPRFAPLDEYLRKVTKQ